jgi:sulfur carrier protein
VSVLLNGERRELAAGTTVAQLVAGLDAPERGTAVALDAEVVPRSQWASTVVPDGAQVEVLTAIQGG